MRKWLTAKVIIPVILIIGGVGYFGYSSMSSADSNKTVATSDHAAKSSKHKTTSSQSSNKATTSSKQKSDSSSKSSSSEDVTKLSDNKKIALLLMQDEVTTKKFAAINAQNMLSGTYESSGSAGPSSTKNFDGQISASSDVPVITDVPSGATVYTLKPNWGFAVPYVYLNGDTIMAGAAQGNVTMAMAKENAQVFSLKDLYAQADKSEMSKVSELIAVSNSQNTANTSSAASSDHSNANFNGLEPETQLALLVTEMFNGKPYDNTHYGIYMGLPNVIVIYDYGEGAGGWPGHVAKFVDKHDGTFEMYHAQSTGSYADANKDNTSWQLDRTVSTSDILKKYYESTDNKKNIENIKTMLDMSTKNEVFDKLPS